MATVIQLVPGDKVTQGADTSVFVAQTQHPIWPRLRLVIWRMQDGTWSHDALDAQQEVGQVISGEDRTANLRAALLGTP